MRCKLFFLKNSSTYENCTKNLIFSSHKLNANSSRSHFIFFINIECVNSENIRVFNSKLTLVDLAGSEKTHSISKNSRVKEESININRSLFYLRKVINSLSDGKTSIHVPYRDSKLTCLLKTSLGGKGSCLMIGCIHPKEESMDDNLATLSYAYKASSITNKLERNADPGLGKISSLKAQIINLEEELTKAHKHIDMLNSLIEGNVGKVQDSVVENNSRSDKKFFDKIYSKLDDIKEKNDQGHEEVKRSHRLHRGNEMFTKRFLETMTVVKELLIGNQKLRNQLTESNMKLTESEAEKKAIMMENQDLHEKLYQTQSKLSDMESTRKSQTLTDNISLRKKFKKQSTLPSKNKADKLQKLKNKRSFIRSRAKDITSYSNKSRNLKQSVRSKTPLILSYQISNKEGWSLPTSGSKTRGKYSNNRSRNQSRRKNRTRKDEKIRSLNAMDIYSFN